MLTQNPRLAVDWKRRLVVAAAADVVATPPVECWSQWLAGLARRHAAIPVPYTTLQELQLWERIIVDDLPAIGRAAAGLARHARTVYADMREYGVEVRELDGGGEEAEALARWIAAMERGLAHEGRVLAADVPARLLPLIASLVDVRHVLLDGFQRLTPMQQALVQALSAHGVTVSKVAGADAATRPTLAACADAESECRHVAARIAAIVDADAHARIAIVTAKPGEDANVWRRILDETLLPSQQAADSLQAVAMPGRPLAERPLIRQLLGLLHLAGADGAPHAELAPLLFSPAVRGYAGERMMRAALDARLRQQNRHYLRLQGLRTLASSGNMPQLAAVLDALMAWDARERPAGEWVRAAHALLQSSGFLQADVAGRSDLEIRELNAFRECLATLVAVDAVRSRMPWGAFLSLLSAACRDTPFSLPVHLPQVCVVPMEQIAGLSFDQVYAVGFDEEAVPLPAQPLPLLPLALQRRHGLPRATPALAFAESAFLWRQLCLAAPGVHVSFACNRDERDLHASPLLAGVDVNAVPRPALPAEALETEAWDDAPPVPLHDTEAVGGGSDLIRSQSACPFRAFARYRLALAPLGETRPGIEPAAKGSLIHDALQSIWERLGSQQALLALDEASLRALILAAIDAAWDKARTPVAAATQHYERQRMAAVLHEWLGEERNRPAFTVTHCEKPYSLSLPTGAGRQFKVKLKADRIDHDGDGRKILIDYKSGKPQTAGKWIGERMEQPQLPLYSMAEGLGAHDAVCFARVRSGECGFEGLSGEDTGIKGIEMCDGKRGRPDDWPALQDAWKQSIDALAAEFAGGRSQVAPRDARACEYCGLEAVCRIDEIGIDDGDADGEGNA